MIVQVVRSSDNALNNFSHLFIYGYLITQCCKLLCSGKLILGYSTPKTRGHVDFRAGRDKWGRASILAGRARRPSKTA